MKRIAKIKKNNSKNNQRKEAKDEVSISIMYQYYTMGGMLFFLLAYNMFVYLNVQEDLNFTTTNPVISLSPEPDLKKVDINQLNKLKNLRITEHGESKSFDEEVVIGMDNVGVGEYKTAMSVLRKTAENKVGRLLKVKTPFEVQEYIRINVGIKKMNDQQKGKKRDWIRKEEARLKAVVIKLSESQKLLLGSKLKESYLIFGNVWKKKEFDSKIKPTNSKYLFVIENLEIVPGNILPQKTWKALEVSFNKKMKIIDIKETTSPSIYKNQYLKYLKNISKNNILFNLAPGSRITKLSLSYDKILEVSTNNLFLKPLIDGGYSTKFDLVVRFKNSLNKEYNRHFNGYLKINYGSSPLMFLTGENFDR